jgi:hypothetical protein
MRKITAALLVSALLALTLFRVGCAEEAKEGARQGVQAEDLLAECKLAMSGLVAYRVSGRIEMSAEEDETAETGLPMNIEFQSEIQAQGAEVNRHIITSTSSGAVEGEYEMEYFLIGKQGYLRDPNQGWLRMDLSAYMIQELNTGFIDAQKVALMVGVAGETNVFAEDEEVIGISFEMDENYLKAAFEAAGEYIGRLGGSLPGEWRQSMEEMTAGYRADVRMWVRRDSKFVDRMEIDSRQGVTPTMSSIERKISVKLFDFNQDIRLVLPEEARKAKELTVPGI